MDTTLLHDIIRYGHLLSVVMAMGAAFFADWTVLRSLRSPISFNMIETLVTQHKFTGRMFVVVWLTGAIFIWWRTGFATAELNPRMIGEVLTATILSLNAFVIAGVTIPLMRRNIGCTFLDLTLRHKLTVALATSVSTTSWLLALALGTSQWLENGGWAVITPLLLLAYSAGIIAGFFVTFVLHFAFIPDGPNGKAHPMRNKYARARPFPA